MNTLIHFVWQALQNGRLATLMLDASLKSLVVLILALTLLRVLAPRARIDSTPDLVWSRAGRFVFSNLFDAPPRLAKAAMVRGNECALGK